MKSATSQQQIDEGNDMKKLSAVVMLSLAVAAQASAPRSPEAQAEQQSKYCAAVGDMFAAVAAARDRGLKPAELDFDAPDELSAAAVSFVYSNPTYPAGAAAWYGFGFCMALTLANSGQV